ncbi:hypothetical protein BJ508DRAFT_332283 [Ascobolus immersus RN42]|uniref:BTB domain-containing protein n=1 Tax=Ascobolus immersus RN42 TaxID=1160509 RepID=A0A3N4HPK7_ASCIM|nr:hypothetical protein BJ508DRAFT_332283 [Ascobolus immersus RN42]
MPAWKVTSSPTITVRFVKPPVITANARTTNAFPSPEPDATWNTASPEPAVKKRKLSSIDAVEKNSYDPEPEVLGTFNLHIAALKEKSDYFASLMSFNGREVGDNQVDIEITELDCPLYKTEGDGWKYAVAAARCFVDFIYSGTFDAADHLDIDQLETVDSRKGNRGYQAKYRNGEEFEHIFLVNVAAYILADRLLAKQLKKLVLQRMYKNLDGFTTLFLRWDEDMWSGKPRDLVEFNKSIPDFLLERKPVNFFDSFGFAHSSRWMNGIKWIFDGTSYSTTNADIEEDLNGQNAADEASKPKLSLNAWERRREEKLRRMEQRERLVGKEPMRRLISAFVLCFWLEPLAAGFSYEKEEDKYDGEHPPMPSGDLTARNTLLECIPELQRMMDGYRKTLNGMPSPQAFCECITLEEFEKYL